VGQWLMQIHQRSMVHRAFRVQFLSGGNLGKIWNTLGK